MWSNLVIVSTPASGYPSWGLLCSYGAAKLEAKGTHTSLKEILRLEPDCGVTNIRNTASTHWKRWLGADSRCLVPFTSFSEYDTIDGKKAGLVCGG